MIDAPTGPTDPGTQQPEAAALDALRRQGAAQCDPVHWHHVETLARRHQGATDPGLRAVLGHKLQAAMHAHAARMAASQAEAAPAVAGGVDAPSPAAATQLAELNRYIAAAQHAQRLRAAADVASSDRLGSDEPDDPSEMQSLRRFRHTWAQLATDQQVTQAIARGPDNAGPLNSHRLVIRTLALMRQLSPDYLRRFVSQVDVLLWLDQAQQKLTLPPAGRSGPHKPAPAKTSSATKRGRGRA